MRAREWIVLLKVEARLALKLEFFLSEASRSSEVKVTED